MSLINFDLSLNPEKPTLTFKASMHPSSVTITLQQPVDISVSAKPSTGVIVGGAIAGAILGGFVGGGITVGVVYGVAAAVGKVLTDKIVDELKDPSVTTHTQSFGSPIGFSQDFEGVKINVTAETLKLSTFQGMLMAEATVKVS
jgi:uncharacterized protein YcfJ